MKSDETFPASRSFVQEFKGRQRLDIFGQKLGGEFKPTASVIAGRFKVRWQRLNLDAGKVNSSRLDVPCVTLPEILTVKDGTDLQLGLVVIGFGCDDGSGWNEQTRCPPSVGSENSERKGNSGDNPIAFSLLILKSQREEVMWVVAGDCRCNAKPSVLRDLESR
jgi:hypothetical protein